MKKYKLPDRRLPPRFNWFLQFSGYLCAVRWFETDVSGLFVGPIFKGEAVSEEASSWTACPFKMGPIGSPETSASNHLTARSNLEDGRINAFLNCKIVDCLAVVVAWSEGYQFLSFCCFHAALVSSCLKPVHSPCAAENLERFTSDLPVCVTQQWCWLPLLFLKPIICLGGTR